MKQVQCLVADEATYLKGNCKRTQAFKELIGSIPFLWYLSATPLMNDLRELHNIIGQLDPFRFDTWDNFRWQFLQTNGNGNYTVKNLKDLHCKIEALVFRKRKDEVAEQLPEKIFKDIPVILTDEQKDTYTQIRNRLLVNLSKEANNPHWLTVTNALAEITRLKQTCDSLKLLGLTEGANPKIEELKHLLKENLCNHKVIVFTQYERMARILEDELSEFKPILLSGSVPIERREDLTSEFQNNAERRVFITTSAGGMGITLTAAAVVVLFDVLWNPKMMEQIIGRADRIGNSRKTLLILNLIAENSIESRILERCRNKSILFDAVIDNVQEAQFSVGKLTPEEIARLVGAV